MNYMQLTAEVNEYDCACAVVTVLVVGIFAVINKTKLPVRCACGYSRKSLEKPFDAEIYSASSLPSSMSSYSFK
jgi:hypothetical protein